MTGLPFLFRSDSFFAIDKPPGALVIPGRGEAAEPSLRERFEAELGHEIYVVHRLDRETSGVLLFALTAEAHRTLSMAFEAGQVSKTYLALVAGRLERAQEIEVALAPARRGRMRPTKPGEEGKAARTRVSPVELFSEATLVEAMPLTGRTHQIRVHLAAIGHPLLVDRQYGRPEDFGALRRTPLHAARAEFPSLAPGIGPLTIEAPLPEDIAATLETLRQGVP